MILKVFYFELYMVYEIKKQNLPNSCSFSRDKLFAQTRLSICHQDCENHSCESKLSGEQNAIPGIE